MKLPDRVAFTIPGLGLEVYWYAICITLGIIAAVVIAGICAKKRRMPVDTAIDLCLWTVPLGLIFARLYYVLFDLSSFHSLADVINIRTGGLAIPGGIIGGFIGVCIYSLIKKKRILGYADIAVPGVALAQAIGRWGNFFNQEAYGIAITNPKLMLFPLAVKIENCTDCTVVGQHAHMATFFYESMFCLLIFIVLMLLTSKKKMKHNGDIFLLYALMYSFERTIIEQFRMDSLMLGKFRVTQLLCAVLFVAVLLIFIIRAMYEKYVGHIVCAVDYDEYFVAPTLTDATADADSQQTDLNENDTASDNLEQKTVAEDDDKSASDNDDDKSASDNDDD